MSRLSSLSSATRMRGGLCIGTTRLKRNSVQEAAKCFEECNRIVRLRHISIAAGRVRPLLVTAQCVGRDHDHGYVLERGIGLDAAGGLLVDAKRELGVPNTRIRPTTDLRQNH